MNFSTNNDYFVLTHTIDIGTVVAYKIFPGAAMTNESFAGQTNADWSGLYAQFSIEHAVSYVCNHYDRGHEEVILVAIIAKAPVKCIIFADKSFSDPSLSSDAKADQCRHALAMRLEYPGLINDSTPLVKSIGEDLDACLVVYDSDEMEIVFPHSYINFERFDFHILASMQMKLNQPWSTALAQINTNSIENAMPIHLLTVELTKDEKNDARSMGRKLEVLVHEIWPRCSWIEEIGGSIKSIEIKP